MKWNDEEAQQSMQVACNVAALQIQPASPHPVASSVCLATNKYYSLATNHTCLSCQQLLTTAYLQHASLSAV